MTPAFANFVAEHGMALVIVDRVNQPDLFPVWDELVQAGVAPDFALIRWIGDDKNGPQGDAELVAPRDEQLDRWAQRLATWQQRGLNVYGYMHNPYEGHSPASLQRLRARVAPLAALPTWPLPDATSAMPDQLSLF